MPTMHLIKYVHSQKSEKSNTFKVFEGKGYPKVFEGKVTQKSLRAKVTQVFEGKITHVKTSYGYLWFNQLCICCLSCKLTLIKRITRQRERKNYI